MSRIFNVASIFIYLTIIWQHASSQLGVSPESVHYLEPGSIVENERQGLRIFCHRSKSKYLIHIWKTLTLDLKTNIDTYDLYDGSSPREVKEKHEENQRSWRFNWLGTKGNKRFRINPFEDTCIGVYVHPTERYIRYTMTMNQTSIDVWKLMAMLTGIIIFFSARRISKNTLFYYICGITLGVTTSILILIYFCGKLLPRGKTMYLMVAAGWTMSFYLAQVLWENAQVILMNYKEYVMWYILTTSLISFVICYRFGPVTNVRTKKIIQWFLQTVGLVVIYYSSYFQEASFTCCILVVLLYNFPVVIIHRGRKYWKNMFPKRKRLLTETEYRQEGVKETRKALDELREYCSSPECRPWKTVLKLKDPIRFAKFIEGESHLSDSETQEHDAEITRLVEEYEYSDDEDWEN